MHGGRIEVASDGATGSDFVVTLPLGWRRPAAPGFACVGGGAEVATGALTVLCVDDEPDVLTLLQRTLEESGYRVVLASSAEEALARAGAAEPDLVCLDLGLPDADGLAVVRRLREEPALACVPVVVVAAAGDEARAIAGGARRLLVKPIDPETLRATVAHVFASRVSSVLVVDDDADVRKLLRDTFERQGIGVAVAADGAEAIGRLRETTPDVIVLDLAMPVMDGFEFLRATQDVPAWRDIPVVILTGRELDAADRARLGGTCAVILAKGRDDTVALVKAVTGGRPRTATTEREPVATAAAV
jgi:CheY-like chemotaxis protein